MEGNKIGFLVIGLGMLAGILLIVAGMQLQTHGEHLVQLRSEATAGGGTGTIAEAYYNEVGHCNKGYGLAAFGAGASVIAISLGLGASLMKEDPEAEEEEGENTEAEPG